MAAPTTYTSFIGSLAALTITGVERQFTFPPESVQTADLPATYPRLPFGSDGPLTADGGGGWPTLTGELVYLIEPTGQNTSKANFTATLTGMDNLETGLRAADFTQSKLSWEIRMEIVPVGENDYWALVATVTGHG